MLENYIFISELFDIFMLTFTQILPINENIDLIKDCITELYTQTVYLTEIKPEA